jgi:hypothetical protein
MNATEATIAARRLLEDSSAEAFYDEGSVLHPYLIAVKTPQGELGVIASGRSYTDALAKAELWLTIQKSRLSAGN